MSALPAGMTLKPSLALPIRPDPTPYKDDPILASRFYQMLGTFIVAWGRYEGHFVSTLFVTTALPGAEAFRCEPPVSWKRRAKLWRAIFTGVPTLQWLSAHAIALLEDTMKSVNDRHIVAHDMWRDFISTSPPTLRVNSLKASGHDEVEITTYDVTADVLRAALSEVNALNSRLSFITEAVSFLRPAPSGIPTR